MLSHSGDSTRSTNTMLKIQLQKNLPTSKKLTLTNVKFKSMNNPMEVLLRKISMSPQQEKTATKAMITTSRNSPRKGTCKIYKIFDKIFNFWTYQDLTRQGKAISIEMRMVFQRVAEPNNSSLLENKVDFAHSEAIFDYFALKCILSKLNFTTI
jgi:hypothetical protein